MASILFWTSSYFMVLTYTLLFFGCSSYNEEPCIITYSKEIGGFYDTLTEKLDARGEKVSSLFFKDTVFGACYRHFLSKTYLRNESKLIELDFTESQIADIKNLIIPGFEERNVMFNMLRVILAFLVINAGVIVGSML